jgi:hypothetical protein
MRRLRYSRRRAGGERDVFGEGVVVELSFFSLALRVMVHVRSRWWCMRVRRWSPSVCVRHACQGGGETDLSFFSESRCGVFV